MEWFAFLKCYFGILIVYYALNLIYDYFFGAKKVRPPEEDETSYDVASLIDEESTQYVDPEEDNPYLDKVEVPESTEKLQIREEEKAPPTEEPHIDQEITFSSPPVGQGIPLDDFIQRAKEMSKEIAFS